MSENVFYKLGERLNAYQVKLLLVEPFLNLLKEIYSEEEARLGAEFPLGAFTAADLAAKLKREEKPLTELLERMADNGTIFVTKDKNETRYALTPFVPGVVEFQLMRATDTPHDRRMARLFEDFMEGEMGDLMTEVLKDKAVAKQMVPEPPARTVTIEKELPKGGTIYPFEKVSEMISKETSFSAAKCYCRHHAFLIDRHCQVKGVPEYSCLMFGKVADYIVDRKFGKRITREESLKIAEACSRAGLVHNVNNFIDGTVFMCNCCGCCCGFLRMLKKFNTDAMLQYSNFMVRINADECTGCGTCEERCPTAALSLKDNVMTVNPERCVGCGNCATVCPVECMTMERRAEKVPPQVGNVLSALGV